MSKNQKLSGLTSENDQSLKQGLAGDLDEVARQGALRMLREVLEAEVEEFLGRKRHERVSTGSARDNEKFCGHRNGYGKERRVTVGSGTLSIRAPRVRETAERFASQVLRSYERRSDRIKELIPELYVQGLATGDFEPALRGLLGDGANLSPTTVTRLKAQWEEEYEQWRKRPLDEHGYAYLWCDGVYPKAGLREDKTAFLVVMGANDNGVKELLALVEGYRESTESWAEVLRDLKARGLADPKLFIGDGALGLWSAINEVYPNARQQRCWVHKMRNVLTHFPQRLHPEVKLCLQRMYIAETKDENLDLLQQFTDIYGREYPRGVECLLKDQDALLTFYSYPQEHWLSIKTTNPIESVFATVKLRTNAARRIKSPRSALCLVFQLFLRAQRNWRRLNASHLVIKVIEGVEFKDGLEVKPKKQSTGKNAA
ncbi:MAG: IS256 family transposase [Candidatus Eisenbacteria bacterium]|nr:IS256 family transposase [Candidatus Eisenbacteria bacterium]